MDTHELSLPLKGFGCEATQARVIVKRLTLERRLKRAGMIAGAGLLAALIALPIPLVHFLLVPGALVTGFVLGGMRLSQREIFDSAEGTCPCCGTAQRLGLAGRKFKLPRTVHCGSCGKPLELGPGVAA